MKKNDNSPEILIGHGLPDFKKITPQQITENVPLLLMELKKEFNELEKEIKNKDKLSWPELMQPLYEIGEKLRWSWGVVNHLNGVSNSSELRKAYSEQQPEIVRFSNAIGQSRVIYKALTKLKNNKSNHYLNETQIRIIESEMLSMENRGVALEGKNKNDFNERSEKLAELSTKFSNNVLDATKQWSLLLTKHSEIEGLPSRTLQSLANSAKLAGDKNNNDNSHPTAENGPWRMSLDMPNYIAFLTYAKNRELREIVYKAYVSRASEGDLNNQDIIEEILDLRNQQAFLLGYKNWAELSLATKMADNITAVEDLLEELRSAALPIAKAEIKELKRCALTHAAKEADSLEPWDISFWSEILRKEKFNLDQEKLRPWFPLPQVLEGLFDLCQRLFDITIKSADGEAPVWNKDVRFFNLYGKDETLIASFYLDPYSRPSNKRGGAWMDECLSRSQRKDGSYVLPVAYLICNQTPPTTDMPSLMSFEEVETLFHEFGHGLQHMLTTVDYPQAAGINNVEWDAVELPSQFMENWCLESKTINKIAKHWKDGSSLPKEEFEKLRLSRTFNSGIATLRQVHFALTDIRLHSRWTKNSGITPNELRRKIAINTTVIDPIDEDQFLCAFSHIFAGGYAAGYYSYKWAEVLSADAFSAFEEADIKNEKEIKSIGKRYRETILSLGGSQSPNKIFKEFRGRVPTTDALIRHCGLAITH